MKISVQGEPSCPCGRTDITKLTIAFRNFSNVPQNRNSGSSYFGKLNSTHQVGPASVFVSLFDEKEQIGIFSDPTH